MNKKSGFTLVELLLVMAIIIILSGVILVTVDAQKKRANEAKALAELSGTLQPMLMCLSDDGNVNTPNSGGSICQISGVNDPAYGLWPTPPSGTGFSGYVPGGNFNDNDWYFSINDGTVSICCNSSNSRCKDIPFTTTCDNSTVL